MHVSRDLVITLQHGIYSLVVDYIFRACRFTTFDDWLKDVEVNMKYLRITEDHRKV